MSRPNNIGAGGFQKYIDKELAAMASEKIVAEKIFGYVGNAGFAIDAGTVLYENTLVNDNLVGYTSDVLVDLSMNYTTAITATTLGSQIGGAIGSVIPGAGTAIGIVIGAGIGAGIYFVTDVITINDRTIREHVKDSFDEVLGG